MALFDFFSLLTRELLMTLPGTIALFVFMFPVKADVATYAIIVLAAFVGVQLGVRLGVFFSLQVRKHILICISFLPKHISLT